jgi:uncharacterized protein
MLEILEFIIKNIPANPDDVTITEEVIEDVTHYNIAVNPEDVGRIIGKEGKIIKAIRSIMRVIAIQRGVRVRISVLSENDAVDSEGSEVVETAEQVNPEDESLAVEI